MCCTFRGSRSIWPIGFVLLLLQGAGPATSETSPQNMRRALDPAPDPDYFGYDVALSGGTVAVGATEAVHVFVRVPGGWRQQARLVSPDRRQRELFGLTVALDGNTLVAAGGGPFDGTTSAGVVYVFVRAPETGTWSLQATLEPPEPTGLLFGGPGSLSGDVLAIGGLEVHGNTGEGRIYIFRRIGTVWSLEDTIIDSDAGSFALAGNTLAVGEPGAPPFSAGGVRLFVRSAGEWHEQAFLQSPDLGNLPPATQINFGQAVALHRNTLLVSATAGYAPFRAYVFVRQGGAWLHQATLTDPQARYHGFGWSVALEGDRALIGAFGGQSGRGSFGIGYVYVRTGGQWQLEDELIAPDVHASNNFGPVVSLSGDRAAIVPGYQGGSVIAPGAATVFERRSRRGKESRAGARRNEDEEASP